MDTAIVYIHTNKYSPLTVDKNASEAIAALASMGHDIASTHNIFADGDYQKALNFIANLNADSIVLVGDYDEILSSFKTKFSLDKDFAAYSIEGKFYVFASDLSFDTITSLIVPTLNSRQKTLYSAYTLRTFGLSEEQLIERLSDCLKNKSRIGFKFVKMGHLLYEVQIKYSSKMQRDKVTAIIKQATESLQDVTYSLTGGSLSEVIVKLLTTYKKTLCTVESFTGGALAASIVKIDGASAVFTESMVTYSDAAKQARLGLDSRVLSRFGAVSIEAAYEMAANALSIGGTDFVIATTGNASESIANPKLLKLKKGQFFIAVGTRGGIHIFDSYLDGAREEIIEFGVNTALFNLYKTIKEGFNQILAGQTLVQNQQKGI